MILKTLVHGFFHPSGIDERLALGLPVGPGHTDSGETATTRPTSQPSEIFQKDVRTVGRGPGVIE